MKIISGWLPKDSREWLLRWTDQMMNRGLVPLVEHSAHGLQFRNRPPEFYLQEAAPLEAVKIQVRQEFSLRDHPDAPPGWKVWLSVMPPGSCLPMHQHIFREGCGDLRVNILLQRAEEGGLAGYKGIEYNPLPGDLWFLDGSKDHHVTQVTKGTRVLLSYGFDIPQATIDGMGV